MTVSIDVVPTKTLALYPFTRGLAYSVMTSALDLEEFNLYHLKKYDFERLLTIMREIIAIHKPVTVVLENTNSKYCRKRAHVKQVIRAIALWAKKKDIHIEYYSREQIRTVFEPWHAKSKFEIAEVISRNIDKLKPYMFDKPKYPAREPNVMGLFSAVSMSVTHYFQTD